MMSYLRSISIQTHLVVWLILSCIGVLLLGQDQTSRWSLLWPSEVLPQVLPLAFVPNVGQETEEVQYRLKGWSHELIFTEKGLILLASPQTKTAVTLEFINGNMTDVRATAQLTGVLNYYLGRDEARWFEHVPTYGRITYHELYPGITLHYDGQTGHLKGTFVVNPGADPAQIQWRYGSNDQITLDGSGNLNLSLPNGGMLQELAPVAWQEIHGRRISIPLAYAIDTKNVISFRVGTYNPNHLLIIDPTLTVEFSTYLGGSTGVTAAGEECHFSPGCDIALDGAGNVYVTGKTESLNFPDVGGNNAGGGGGNSDAFVTKFDTNGNLLYSTIVGGPVLRNPLVSPSITAAESTSPAPCTKGLLRETFRLRLRRA